LLVMNFEILIDNRLRNMENFQRILEEVVNIFFEIY